MITNEPRIILFIIFTLILVSFSISFGQTEPTDETERLNLLKKTLKEQIQKERNIKIEQTKTLNEINEIEKKLSLITQEIFNINSELIKLETHYKNILAKIEELNNNIQLNNKILSERLKTYQNTTKIGIFNILFSSKTFLDLYTKNIYLKYILIHDANFKEQYKKELRELYETKASSETTKERLEAKRLELENSKESLKKLKEEKELYWKNLTQSQEEYARMIKELKLAIKDLENIVNKPQIEINLAQTEKPETKIEINTNLGESNFNQMKGKLLLPTEGKLAKNPVKESQGIVIEAPLGSEIRSPADGIISYHGSHPGYGNFVIIDHGDGYRTLIAQASRFFVEIGQSVSMGELLGFTAGGPWIKNGIYVEIQKDKKPINTKEWFKIN